MPPEDGLDLRLLHPSCSVWAGYELDELLAMMTGELVLYFPELAERIAADAPEPAVVLLAEVGDNQERLREIFGPVTPDFGSTKNPIDLTVEGTEDGYRRTLLAVQATMAARLALIAESEGVEVEDGVLQQIAEGERAAGPAAAAGVDPLLAPSLARHARSPLALPRPRRGR